MVSLLLMVAVGAALALPAGVVGALAIRPDQLSRVHLIRQRQLETVRLLPTLLGSVLALLLSVCAVLDLPDLDSWAAGIVGVVAALQATTDLRVWQLRRAGQRSR